MVVCNRMVAARLERNDKSERYLASGMAERGRGINDAQVSRLGN